MQAQLTLSSVTQVTCMTAQSQSQCSQSQCGLSGNALQHIERGLELCADTAQQL